MTGCWRCLSPTETGAEDLAELTSALPPERCAVATVARLVAAHYTNRARSWPGQYRMLAFVGGFDVGESTGRLYTVDAPGLPAVGEALPGAYGMIWGGQRAIVVDRIIAGYDPNLRDALEGQEEYPIQFPFDRLSLADCATRRGAGLAAGRSGEHSGTGSLLAGPLIEARRRWPLRTKRHAEK